MKEKRSGKRIKKVGNRARNNNDNKKIKAIALSQVVCLVLEIFAFAFIIGGMVAFASDSVSGATPTIITGVKGSYLKEGDNYYFRTFRSGIAHNYEWNSNTGKWSPIATLPAKAQFINNKDLTALRAPLATQQQAPVDATSEAANSPDIVITTEIMSVDAAKNIPPTLVAPADSGPLAEVPLGGRVVAANGVVVTSELIGEPGSAVVDDNLLNVAANKPTPLTDEQEIAIMNNELGPLSPAGKTPTVSNEVEYSFLGLGNWKYTQGHASALWGNLVGALGWASAVLTFTQLIGGVFGLDKKGNMLQSLGKGLAAGILAGKAVYGLYETFGAPNTAESTRLWYGSKYRAGISTGVGLLVAYIVFAKEYKKTKTFEQTIEFKCMAWQAPNGGDKCNECNTNPLKPCSEYRCKALGQTCKIINAGTQFEKCIDGSRDDVTSPGIKPWQGLLPEGYAYENVIPRPPGGNGPAGMKITYNGGCLKAWTPFEFGIITTDKETGTENIITQPAQCKIDYNHTLNFNGMAYYMGEDNLYVENHSQVMSLPGTEALNSLYSDTNFTIEVKNNGEYTFYIRCKDGNGNENRDEFAVRFCVDKSPDVTAPIIRATSIPTESYVQNNVDNISINVYVNEPSNCKWSREDRDYISMENEMSCNNELWQMNTEMLYTCTTTLTAIQDNQDNQFYFRCQDKANKLNEMQDGYSYVLKGTRPLTLLNVGPNGTIGSSTSTAVVTLTANTDNGAETGKATCYYSTNQNSGFIEMVNTKSNIHSQPLDLIGGNYTYYIKCVDAGGNAASNSTNFNVFIDNSAPVAVRAYNYETRLIFATDEDSICRYSTISCNFDPEVEGSSTTMPYDNQRVHIAEWKTDQNYYIKCRDQYNNQPDPAECTIILRPFQLAVEE